MTCIVGVADRGAITIGGDSAGVAGLDITARSDEKVFRNGPFLFGFTSSFRMSQLLHYAFEPPARPEGQSVDAFMVTTFINAIRACFKAGGYAYRESEHEIGGCFLVGYAGRLFRIDPDYQVGESHDGYMAVGCGDAYALGVLYASAGAPADGRCTLALEAAAHHSAGVCGPFVIKTLYPEYGT
jgi:ATP-dependent protease HslVU (ClpYQ) peptidase subunit